MGRRKRRGCLGDGIVRNRDDLGCGHLNTRVELWALEDSHERVALSSETSIVGSSVRVTSSSTRVAGLLQREDVGVATITDLKLAGASFREVDGYGRWSSASSGGDLESDQSTVEALELGNGSLGDRDDLSALAVSGALSDETSSAGRTVFRECRTERQATVPVLEWPFKSDVTSSGEGVDKGTSEKTTDRVDDVGSGSNDETREGNVLEGEGSCLGSVPENSTSEGKERGHSNVLDLNRVARDIDDDGSISLDSSNVNSSGSSEVASADSEHLNGSFVTPESEDVEGKVGLTSGGGLSWVSNVAAVSLESCEGSLEVPAGSQRFGGGERDVATKGTSLHDKRKGEVISELSVGSVQDVTGHRTRLEEDGTVREDDTRNDLTIGLTTIEALGDGQLVTNGDSLKSGLSTSSNTTTNTSSLKSQVLASDNLEVAQPVGPSNALINS